MDERPQVERGSAEMDIRGALTALRRGDRATARRLAEEAAGLAPELEAPWLILASLGEPEESVTYALRALEVNPESPRARQALAWAQGRLGTGPLVGKKPAGETPTAEKPPEAKAEEQAAPASPEALPGVETSPEPGPQAAPAPAQEEAAVAGTGIAQPELGAAVEPAVPQVEPIASTAKAQTEVVPAGEPEVAAVVTQEAARPAAPSQEGKKPSLSRPARWLIGVIAIAVIGLVVAGIAFGPELANLLKPPVPTPQCVKPTLTLGTASFTIQSIQRAADGSVTLPQGTIDTAYWVEGTTVNYVFGLAGSANTLALPAFLKTGDSMTIRWADCGREEYVVKEVEDGPLDMASLLDQSVPGITVFIPSNAVGEGYILRGVRPQALVTTTPELTVEGATQAQVDFLETATSQDGKTLNVTVAVTNLGSQAFTIKDGDISLADANGNPQAPTSVTPALPQTVPPNAKITLALVFANPPANTGVFRLLDFSVDLYY